MRTKGRRKSCNIIDMRGEESLKSLTKELGPTDAELVDRVRRKFKEYGIEDCERREAQYDQDIKNINNNIRPECAKEADEAGLKSGMKWPENSDIINNKYDVCMQEAIESIVRKTPGHPANTHER